jgi:hypothetical protein
MDWNIHDDEGHTSDKTILTTKVKVPVEMRGTIVIKKKDKISKKHAYATEYSRLRRSGTKKL